MRLSTLFAVLTLSLAVTISPTSGSFAQSSPSPVSFEIELKEGKPVGARVIRVKQGDEVNLKVIADKPMELHLHGYDIEKHTKPGAAVIFNFTAKATGRFPLTEHGAGHSHGHGETALFYLEVHPR